MNDNYIDLFAAIYAQAVRDDCDTVASNIVRELKDMSIKEKDARRYIKTCEEAMAEIKQEIRHNVYRESKEYGDPVTRAMQAHSISSFEGRVNELVKAYRMTDKEKNDRVATCQEMEKNIAQLLEEKERWQAIAEKVTPTITGMPGGSDGEQQRELAVCNMVDCDKDATKAIDKLCDYKDKIKHYIVVTGDDDSRLLGLLKEQE